MAASVSQIQSQISKSLADTFQQHYTGTTKPSNAAGIYYSTVGSNSKSPSPVALQSTGGAQGGFYVSTFQDFNTGTAWDSGLNKWVASASEPKFTQNLQNLYGIMKSTMSGEQAAAQAKAAAENSTAVDNFWNTWIGTFGYDKPLAKEGINNKYQWVTLQRDPVTDQPSYGNVSNTNKWNAINNSVNWMCQMATKDENIAYALTNNGRKLLINQNKKEEAENGFAPEMSATLNEMVASGSYNFSQLFNNSLTQFSSNPWAQNFNAYTNMIRLQGLGTAGTAIYEQQDNNRANAQQILLGYNSGGSQAQNILDTLGAEAFSNIWSNSGVVPATYPKYLPAMNTPGLSEGQISTSVTSQRGEWNFDQTISSSDGSTYSYKSNDDTTTWDSQTSASWYLFWGSGSTESSKTNTQTNISDYDSSFVNNGMTISYDVSQQTFEPKTTGTGAWLLLDALSGPVGVFTKASNRESTYVYDTNFGGGYGFTSPAQAKNYLQAGLAYQKHMLFSVNPTISIDGETKNASKWDYEQNTKTDKSWTSASGWGVFDWLWGAGSAGADGGTSQTTTEVTKSEFSSDGNTLGINYTGAALLNPNKAIKDPLKGYMGLPIGLGIQQIATPQDVQTLTASKRSARSESIDAATVIANKGSRGSKIDVVLGNRTNTFYGHSRRDIVKGGGGHDNIFGLNGNDEIHGGPGSDFISGGQGRNRMRGNGGKDVFEFNNSEIGSKRSMHIIEDFDLANDMLHFTGGLMSDSLSSKGNNLFYDDKKVGKLIGLSALETAMAVDSSSFV